MVRDDEVAVEDAVMIPDLLESALNCGNFLNHAGKGSPSSDQYPEPHPFGDRVAMVFSSQVGNYRHGRSIL